MVSTTLILVVMKPVELPRKKRIGRPRTFDPDVALDKAMRLFWRRGYEATSMSELIAEMGMTPSSIYSVFGDKAALYRQAAERYWAGPSSYSRDIYAAEPTAKLAIGKVLRAAARAMVDPSQPPGCMVALSAINCSEENGKIQEMMSDYRERSEQAMKERIQRGIDEGDVPRDADAAALAGYFSSVIYGMSIKARDGASVTAMTSIAEAAMKAWPKGSSATRKVK
jgi:AcrR family transcriptional regulator